MKNVCLGIEEIQHWKDLGKESDLKTSILQSSYVCVPFLGASIGSRYAALVDLLSVMFRTGD